MCVEECDHISCFFPLTHVLSSACKKRSKPKNAACLLVLHVWLQDAISSGRLLRQSCLTSWLFVQLLFTVSVTPVIHNWWDIQDQNAQLVELIMFFKVIRHPILVEYSGCN